jgi:6-pyruvoyltetrahydropterin/6-carboxytetrahydropterin synthase
MWTLEKEFRFEASHVLPHQGGKCSRLHGHSWKGRVVVQAAKLHEEGPEAGMVMDFNHIAAILDPLIERYLDHRHLNDIPGMENPTSEEIARWLYRQLKPKLPHLVAVEIDETCTSRCRYVEEA